MSQPQRGIRTRTLDGRLWLDATDVVTALHGSAVDYEEGMQDEAAGALRWVADQLDFRGIVHRTESPNDSPGDGHK